jgi:biopolymer transport protein ExbD
MAQIQPQPTEGKTKRKVHPALSIDMTPMVDLGFLLITFFIFTTTMAEQKALHLVMPKESTDSTEVGERKALTVILGKDNKVFVYAGKWQSAVNHKGISQTNYNVYQGMGSFIRAKQKQLRKEKDDLMLLIKPLSTASYQNVIDALDEALINNVQRYAIVDASAEEKAYIDHIQ